MAVAEFLQNNPFELMYMSSCIIGTAAYMPQAMRLLKDKTDSGSVAISSWMIWVYTTCVGFGYAAFVNGDPLLMLSTGLSALCCLVITAMLVFNRYGKLRFYGRTDISVVEVLFKRYAAAPLIIMEKPAPVPYDEDPHSLA